MRKSASILLSLSLCVLSTCNRFVAYAPDKIRHARPADYGLIKTDVNLISGDGLSLEGWYLQSERFAAKSSKHKVQALILQFHGNAQNLSSHFTSLAWLVHRGYDLFIFDYRGYGRSQGRAEPSGTYLDALAALRFAVQEAKKRNLKLIVYAQSLGGVVSLGALEDFKDYKEIDLFIADSTFLSYKRVGSQILKRAGPCPGAVSFISYCLLSDSYAPGAFPGILRFTPLIVIHHERDPVIDFQNGLEIFRQAQELGAPVRLLRLPGENHTSWRGPEREKLKETLSDLIADILRASP